MKRKPIRNLVVVIAMLSIFTCGSMHAQVASAMDDLTFTVNGVSFVMKPVEGGTFMMGAQSTNPNEQNYDPQAHENEAPTHMVTLDTYYIGETEVTQALWKAVMGEPEGTCSWFVDFGLGDNYPAYRVTWDNSQEFIQRLNQLTGKNFRLPTEAEWEYAARGGKKSKGYRYAGGDDVDKVAWYFRNSGDKYLDKIDTDNPFFYEKVILPNNPKAHQVKSKLPNELGLYDMSGNVQEWCGDYYDKDYYSESPSQNPQGPEKNKKWDYRVVRSCGYLWDVTNCRVSERYFDSPNAVDEQIGMRLVLSL